jgi:hypothetical protein
MSETLHRIVMLFRFALREGDWLLAAALAETPQGRAAGDRLELELVRSGPGGAVGLGALRTIATLARALGLR